MDLAGINFVNFAITYASVLLIKCAVNLILVSTILAEIGQLANFAKLITCKQ